MKEAWVESIRRQCADAQVAFFFKQWGGVQKSKNGRLLNERTYDEMPLRQPVNPPPREHRLKLASTIAGMSDWWNAPPLVELATKSGEVIGSVK
jgi:hypothetical protein